MIGVVGGQDAVQLCKEGVNNSKPLSGVLENEPLYVSDVVRLVILEVPLHFGQLALVEEPAGHHSLFKATVQFSALCWGGEVEEELADPVVNGMLLQDLQVGNSSARFFYQDGTQVIEGFSVFLKQTLVDLVKEVSEFEVIEGSIEYKPLKIV